jgi:hypothetical protein
MSDKIREYQRRAIVGSLLNFRFKPEFKALKLQRHALAVRLYEQVFNDDMRKSMASLPDDWLYETERLYFTIGDCDGDVSFANCERRRVPYKYRDKPVAALEATDVFAMDYRAWEDRCENMDKLRQETSLRVHAALSKFTTTKRLIAEWPEIARFVPNAPQPVRNLPAIPTEQLNAMLHLNTEKVD